MHRLVGVLGMLTMMSFAFLFSTNRRAIRGKTVAWGLGLQIVFAYLVMQLDLRPVDFPKGRRRRELGPRFRLLRLAIRFRRPREKRLAHGLLLRLPGSADHHFHRRRFRAALLLRRDAVHHQASRACDDRPHGRERRGISQRRRQHFHGPDRSAAHHPSLSSGSHAIRTHDHHDQRHGPRFRRHDGRLHRLRRRSQAPPRRRDHDRARNNPAFQNAGPRNGNAGNFRQRGNGAARTRRQRPRRARSRHRRRPKPRA